MAKPKSIAIQFGSSDFDISKALGPKTRRVLDQAREGTTHLIDKLPLFGRLKDAQVLATGAPLSIDQIQLIRDATNDPKAYYNGRPIFKRLPPNPSFAIQIVADTDTIDLMVDLQNPSWGFFCDDEIYQQWNWVGNMFIAVAKESFPELASPNRGSIWRIGAIAKLRSDHNNSTRIIHEVVRD